MCGGWNALNCLGCSLVGFGGGLAGCGLLDGRRLLLQPLPIRTGVELMSS